METLYEGPQADIVAFAIRSGGGIAWGKEQKRAQPTWSETMNAKPT